MKKQRRNVSRVLVVLALLVGASSLFVGCPNPMGTKDKPAELSIKELASFLKNKASDTEVNYIILTGLTNANLENGTSDDKVIRIIQDYNTKKLDLTLKGSFDTIGQAGFTHCSQLVRINLPENVKTISEDAFDSCTGLEYFEVPKEVTSIGDTAFEDCSNLKYIQINEKIKTVGFNAFSGCTKARLSIPKSKETEIKLIVSGKGISDDKINPYILVDAGGN